LQFDLLYYYQPTDLFQRLCLCASQVIGWQDRLWNDL